MAFERSTPLPLMSREPVEKPFIPRGPMPVLADFITHRHENGTVTFSDRAGSFKRTYHRATVISETTCGDEVNVLVTPSTVVTWDRLP